MTGWEQPGRSLAFARNDRVGHPEARFARLQGEYGYARVLQMGPFVAVYG